MNVPMMGPTTPINVPGRFFPTTPHIEPITQAASGVNVDEANANFGKTLSNVSAGLAEHLIATQNFNNEQKSNDAATQSLNNLKDVHDKLMQTQGVNAIGIHSGETPTTIPPLQAGKLDVGGVNNAPIKTTTIDPNSFVGQRAALRAKGAEGLTPEQQDHYFRVFDNGAEVLDRSVARHEAEQTQVAQEQGIASRNATGAQIFAVNPFDPNSKAALDKAYSDTDSLSKLHGEDTNTSTLRKQQVTDLFMTSAAKNNPANAAMLLEKYGANMSPEAQSELRGMKLDFTVRHDFTNGIPDSKTAIGSYDMDKVEAHYRNDSTLTPDEQDKAIDSFRSMENKANFDLSQQNKAKDSNFYSEITKPGVTLGQQKQLANDNASMFRDGSIDHNDLRDKLAAIDEVNKPHGPRVKDDIETVIALDKAIDDGDVSNVGPIAEAHKNESIGDATYKRLVERVTGEKSAIMQNTWKDIQSDIQDKNAGDVIKQHEMESTLRLYAHSKNITDPDALWKAYNDYSQKTKSGASSLFGLINHNKEEGDLIRSAQQTPALTKSVGGADNMIKAYQKLGGPDLFVQGSPESEVLEAYSKKGWSIDKITPEMFIASVEKYKAAKK